MAKRYKNSKGEFLENHKKEVLLGTKFYSSANVLQNHVPSRRDDLISACYMIFEMIFGKLPWDESILRGKFFQEDGPIPRVRIFLYFYTRFIVEVSKFDKIYLIIAS